MAISFPVEIITQKITSPNLEVYYPKVRLSNPAVEQVINNAIYKLAYDLIAMQGYFKEPETGVLGWYEIKNNQRDILSLSLGTYGYLPPSAHGMTYIKSLTFDVRTGKIYSLGDLFEPGSDYVKRISDNIRVQIKERDIPLLDGFESIRPDQDYYIADNSIVVYFQQYEITPYYVGLPAFPVSIYSLEDIVLEGGPLSIMAPSNP
jgi:hypothetical protein